MIDNDRVAAHGAKGAYRAVYAADEHVRGAPENFLGAGPLHFTNPW